MNKITGKLVLLLCLFGFAPEGFTQQQAGAVVQEIHRRSNPNHPGYPGYSVPTQPREREVWQNRYGALAADYEAGRSGVAEDENSLRAARRKALQRCGTKKCKLVGSVTNGCLAVAYGGGNAVGAGETMNQALQDAIDKCQSDGSACEIHYAHCNSPIRIR